MGARYLVVAIAGCYAPSLTPGLPCSATFECPGDQQCNRTTTPPTCGTPGVSPDAAIDAPVITIDVLDAGTVWSTPTLVPIVVGGFDDDPSLTTDLLELYFNRGNNVRLMVATRSSTTAPWSTPIDIAEIAAPGYEVTTPEVGPDGLSLRFASERPGSLAGVDLWVTRRATRQDTWDPPSLISELASPARDINPFITGDQLTMLLDQQTTGVDDKTYVTTRPTIAAAWGTPVLISELDVPGVPEGNAVLSGDELTIYFDSGGELMSATRASLTTPFAPATPITGVNSPAGESDPWISPDGRHLYFTSTRDGTSHLWESAR